MAQRTLGLRADLSKTVFVLCIFFIGTGTVLEALVLAGPPAMLSLSVNNQQVSAHIIRAPLKHALATLTAHGPFRFILKGDAKDDVISASFRHLSFMESVQTLLLGYDYAIVQRPLDPALSTTEMPYLMEVVVLSRNQTEPPPGEDSSSLISFQKTYTQPVLLPTNQEHDKSNQPDSLSIERDNDANHLQTTIDEALQDTDL